MIHPAASDLVYLALSLLLVHTVVQYVSCVDNCQYNVFGLEYCSCPSLSLDDTAQAVLLDCNHTAVTASFDVVVPPEQQSPLIVAELSYYDKSTDQNVTQTFLYKKYLPASPASPVLQFEIDPPLDQSVTQWTVLFCYQSSNSDQFALNPATCKIGNKANTPVESTLTSASFPLHQTGLVSPSSTNTLLPSPKVNNTTMVPLSSSSSSWNTIYSSEEGNGTGSPAAAAATPPTSSMTSTSVLSLMTTLSDQGKKSSKTTMLPSSRVKNSTTVLFYSTKTSSYVFVTTPPSPFVPTSNASTTYSANDNVAVGSADASGGVDVVTILIVTLFLCVTVVVMSFSFAFCIIRFTKHSRDPVVALSDDEVSNYGRISRMDKDIYSSSLSVTSSVITTLAPLAWEERSSDTHNLTNNPNHHSIDVDFIDNATSIKHIKVFDSANSINGGTTTILYTMDNDSAHIPPLPHPLRTHSSIITSTCNSDSSDTSGNTVNLANINEMDRISEISISPNSVYSIVSSRSLSSLQSLDSDTDEFENDDIDSSRRQQPGQSVSIIDSTLSATVNTDYGGNITVSSPYNIEGQEPGTPTNDSNTVYIVLTSRPNEPPVSPNMVSLDKPASMNQHKMERSPPYIRADHSITYCDEDDKEIDESGGVEILETVV